MCSECFASLVLCANGRRGVGKAGFIFNLFFGAWERCVRWRLVDRNRPRSGDEHDELKNEIIPRTRG